MEKLIDFAIRRRVTVIMCTVAIALFGVVSLSRLKLNLLPDLSYPTLTIRTELPGRGAARGRDAGDAARSRKPSASSATCARCARSRAPASPT